MVEARDEHKLEPERSDATEVAGPRVYTLDEAYDVLGFGRTQIFLFFFVGMAWMGDGAEMMLLSYLGPEVKCKWGLSAAQESWITSAVFLGMMAGSFTWGTLSDAYGRKLGFFAPAAFTGLFGVISAFSVNYTMLIICRTLVGFGIAGAHVAYTLFMEFLAPTHRGRYLSFIESFWTLGAVFVAGMAWLVLPTVGWQMLVLLAVIPLTLLLLIYPFIKESPHWLLAQGREADAQAVLEWVARLNGKPLPPGRVGHHSEAHTTEGAVELSTLHQHGGQPIGESQETGAVPDRGGLEAREVGSGDDVMETIDLGNDGGPSSPSTGATPPFLPTRVAQTSKWKSITGSTSSALDSLRHSLRQMGSSRELRLTSALLMWIWIGVALSYYGLILLNVEMHAEQNEECNADGSATISSSDFQDVFVTSFGEVAGFVLSMGVIDFLGRRRCLWLFLFATVLCLVPLLRPAIEHGTAPVDVFVLFLTRCFTYAAFIALYIYTPEVYPTRVRSFAFGIFNAFCRFGGLVAPFVAVDMLEKVSVRSAVAFFLVVSLISAVLAFALPIETKGRELLEDAQDFDLQRFSTGAIGGWQQHMNSPVAGRNGNMHTPPAAVLNGSSSANPFFFEAETGIAVEYAGKQGSCAPEQ